MQVGALELLVTLWQTYPSEMLEIHGGGGAEGTRPKPYAMLSLLALLVQKYKYGSRRRRHRRRSGGWALRSIQFSSFTGTKAQILTQKGAARWCREGAAVGFTQQRDGFEKKGGAPHTARCTVSSVRGGGRRREWGGEGEQAATACVRVGVSAV